jgi:hypothetical protein
MKSGRLILIAFLTTCLAGATSSQGQTLGPDDMVVIDQPGATEPLDLDAWLRDQGNTQGPSGCWDPDSSVAAPYVWQLVPAGLLYKSYLAGVHEPRFGIVGFEEKNLGWLWDSVLGGRVGLLRYGTPGSVCPQGFQIDFEGAVFIRQNEHGEMVSTDFRAGVPLTYACGCYQMKLGYYHVSSHLGDEFLLSTGTPRINYVRDAVIWGHSLDLTEAWRAYFEIGYSFSTDGGSKPWELQFGAEYSTQCATDIWGSPFLALNGHLREDVDFGGNFVAQAGWQWRGGDCGRLLRVGLQYYNGKSPQYEFFDQFEEQIGFGVWYDF